MSPKHRIPPGHRAPVATTIALIESEIPDGMRCAAHRLASMGLRVLFGRRISKDTGNVNTAGRAEDAERDEFDGHSKHNEHDELRHARADGESLAVLSVIPSQPGDPITFCASLVTVLRAHGYHVVPQEQISEVGTGGRIHVRVEYDGGDNTIGIIVMGLHDRNLLAPVTMLRRAEHLAAFS